MTVNPNARNLTTHAIESGVCTLVRDALGTSFWDFAGHQNIIVDIHNIIAVCAPRQPEFWEEEEYW